MPEGPEVETTELQDKIHEAHEGHHAEESAPVWIKYVALSTAILAVFAAIGALNAGDLVNEAMFRQLKSSDTWNEYQADKQKGHQYQVALNGLLDRGVKPSQTVPKDANVGLDPADRAALYLSQVQKESGKTVMLAKSAGADAKEAEKMLHQHRFFAQSVALIQVAIALGAVSALTKIRLVWIFGLLIGITGIFYFVLGFR